MTSGSRANAPVLTRRVFLARAAAAAVAGPVIVRASSVGAQGRSPSERIAVACVGVRNMGGGHLKGLVRNNRARVVAVCDVDSSIRQSGLDLVERTYGEERAAGAFRGCQGTGDFRELLSRPDVDALVIAVPDHWHAPMTIAACRAGKDVYCEKPLSLTINQGKAMVAAVRRHGRVFQTGTQRRSFAVVRHVCELVRNGRIGKLLKVTAGVGRNNVQCEDTWQPEPVPPELDYDMWLGPAPWEPYHHLRCHYSFRFVLDYSGGQVTNNGAHWTDVAQWGIGADGSGPLEIEGAAEYPRTGLFNTASKIDFTATYASGAQLNLTSDGGSPRFFGTEGWLSVEGAASRPALLKSEVGPNEIRLYRSEGSHMDNFLECVRTRREPAAPVEVGHRGATVAHLGNIAMRLGRKVRWDPVAERFIDDPEADRMMDRAMRGPWTA